MAGNRRNKRKVNKIVIILAVFAVICISAVVFVKYEFRITKINITGSDRYTYDELYSYIFADRNSSNMLLFRYTNKKNAAPDIPFISKTEFQISWPNTLNITVYEKKIVGYIQYKGSYMYFDKDGIIVESSRDILEGVPQISGLMYNTIVLYSKLNVENLDVFTMIHNITQYLEKYSIKVDEINVAEDNSISLVMDEVTILLGMNDYNIGDKIYELSCMSEQLTGRRGTLHLENYSSSSTYVTFTDDDASKETLEEEESQ